MKCVIIEMKSPGCLPGLTFLNRSSFRMLSFVDNPLHLSSQSIKHCNKLSMHLPPLLSNHFPNHVSMSKAMLCQQVYRDRKSTRLNSSHSQISYAVFCLKKKK